MLPPQYLHEIALDGFSMCRAMVASEAVDGLVAALANSKARAGSKGLRNLLRSVPAVRALAGSPPLNTIVTTVLGPDAWPVRAILFDKTSEANWGVGWHQDLTIAVRRRAELSGFDAWTVKDGVPHVQPPAEILENMLTLRLHLDAADGENGALLVSAGSHRQGRLPEGDIASIVEASAVVLCAASVGDVLAFRPLLLHMSRKSLRPNHRRVIQIEYAAAPLPPPLQWYERASPGNAISAETRPPIPDAATR